MHLKVNLCQTERPDKRTNIIIKGHWKLEEEMEQQQMIHTTMDHVLLQTTQALRRDSSGTVKKALRKERGHANKRDVENIIIGWKHYGFGPRINYSDGRSEQEEESMEESWNEESESELSERHTIEGSRAPPSSPMPSPQPSQTKIHKTQEIDDIGELWKKMCLQQEMNEKPMN